jgi:hypothetical protein
MDRESSFMWMETSTKALGSMIKPMVMAYTFM